MTLDVQSGIETTDRYGPRELFRQFCAGAPSVQLIRLGEFNWINASVTVALASLVLVFVATQVSLPWLYPWFGTQVIFIIGMLLYLGRQGMPLLVRRGASSYQSGRPS